VSRSFGHGTRLRPAAVAGAFYPSDAGRLVTMIDDDLTAAPHGGPVPKAIIAPHAGYIYSGPIAGSAYARLAPARGRVSRVILLGPAHRVPVDVMAVPSVDAFDTPIGPARIDTIARDQVLQLAGVAVDDRAHGPEHSLEVHLPFLLRVLGPDISVLPVLVGHATTDQVAELLELFWDDEATLIVVSSDLSHYHDYDTAVTRDRATARAVIEKHLEAIGPYDACGAYPVRGLLEVARRRDLDVELLDLRNSGDTAGDRSRVVGYGAFALR
jgi:AmmeMemoRadiSam system protein B